MNEKKNPTCLTGCFCASQKAYVSAGVPFLMDQTDTVLAYEQAGMDEPFGQNPLVALTSSMDHIQQLEFIYREFLSQRWNQVKGSWLTSTNRPSARSAGFKEMTKSLTSFLDQCAANGKVSCLRLELYTRWIIRKICQTFFFFFLPLWISQSQWKVHNSSLRSCVLLKGAGPNQDASDGGATLVLVWMYVWL